VAVALARMSQGSLSNVKGVGGGVHEYRIDFGPGYRIYLAKDGDRMILLLAVEPRSVNKKDIENARRRWQDYRQRKKQEAR